MSIEQYSLSMKGIKRIRLIYTSVAGFRDPRSLHLLWWTVNLLWWIAHPAVEVCAGVRLVKSACMLFSVIHEQYSLSMKGI